MTHIPGPTVTDVEDVAALLASDYVNRARLLAELRDDRDRTRLIRVVLLTVGLLADRDPAGTLAATLAAAPEVDALDRLYARPAYRKDPAP